MIEPFFNPNSSGLKSCHQVPGGGHIMPPLIIIVINRILVPNNAPWGNLIFWIDLRVDFEENFFEKNCLFFCFKVFTDHINGTTASKMCFSQKQDQAVFLATKLQTNQPLLPHLLQQLFRDTPVADGMWHFHKELCQEIDLKVTLNIQISWLQPH